VPLEGVPVKAATSDDHSMASPRAVLAEGAEALDVGVRLQALGQLVRHSEQPGGGQWSPRALMDPSPYVQRRGVEALRQRLPEPESSEQLVQVVGRPGVEPYTRGLAGRALATQGDTRALPALQDALAASEQDWERAPLALAAAMMGDEQALLPLRVALERGDFPLEVEFFLACGTSGLDGLAEALAQGSARLEEDLVLPAAASLIRLGSSDGETLFREALASDDPELRLQAIDFLADVEGDTATDLIRRARMLGPAPVSRYAEMALVSRGQESAKPAMELSRSLDREDRKQAVWALGGYLAATDSPRHETAVRESLRASLADVELMVVHEAIRSLGRVGLPADVPALEELMQQEFVAVRVAAAGAVLDIQQRASSLARPPTR
jgi:HEAT repeat protein